MSRNRSALAAAILLTIVAGCAAAEESPERSRRPTSRGQTPAASPSLPAITTSARPVTVEAPAPLRFLSGISVTSAHPRWGGLSGIETKEDGDDVLVVSDRGTLFSGRLVREDGALAGLENVHSHTLRDPSGQRWAADDADAEGLALEPDGSILVSFEGRPRLIRYASPDAAAEPLALPAELDGLQGNSGLEALAVRSDGVIALLPERSGREDRPFPVWLRSADGVWSRSAFEREPPFLVTDAAFGPDGQLYVLERDFNLFSWFRARIRRAPIQNDALGPSETVANLQGADNLEGLDIRRDASGRLRLLLVSDDNFNPLQRTLFLEFALDEPRSAAIEPPQ